MLVKDCMTRHPIMVSPDMPAVEAQKIMAENKIRHLPVMGSGKRLLGLITRQRLALKPDTLGSLNMWEITRHLSNLTVEKMMLPAEDVHTIGADRTIERAARELAAHKIGCLPVIEDNVVVGIITEIDLLHAFQDVLGLPAEGIRVTVRMPNKRGEFARLMEVVSREGWGVMGVGSFPSPKLPGFYDIVLKLTGTTLADVQTMVSQIPEQKIVDIRAVA